MEKSVSELNLTPVYPVIPIELKVKYHVDLNEHPEFLLAKSDKGDWVDLRSAMDITLNKGDICKIPLGIAIQLPEGFEAHVEPRSSTLIRRGILGPTGIIDSSYCGDNDIWHFQGYATRAVSIKMGDRIAQFRIFPKMEREGTALSFTTVETLGNPDRSGFGSTGLK